MPAEIEIEGKKFDLGSDFEVNNGPIGLRDFIGMVRSSLSQTSYGRVLESVLQRLEAGDVMTAAALGVTIAVGVYFVYSLWTGDSSSDSSAAQGKVESSEEEKVPPRDFTTEQLREFNGTDGKAIYIGMKGDVFDVSKAKDFYGEGSGYHCFAGREASRAMAKLSFDEAELSNSNIDDLGPFEKDVLNDWYVKFRDYKCYPIIGRVSNPPAVKDFTKEELITFKECPEVPAGRVDAPIYMAINGKIIDVSYGGKEMYGKGGPYFLFAGIDASRALAKMSFKPEDLNNSDLSDLTEEQQKTLSEWEHKFINVRKYPIIGKLVN